MGHFTSCTALDSGVGPQPPHVAEVSSTFSSFLKALLSKLFDAVFHLNCSGSDSSSNNSSGSGSGSGSGSRDKGADALAGMAGCCIDPQEVLFLRWSGETMGASDFQCGKEVSMNVAARLQVQQLILAVAQAPLFSPLPRHLLHTLPKAPTGMIIHEEFGKELAMPRLPAPQQLGQKTQVCVAVLVGGGAGGSQGPPLKQASLADTVQSLQQQRNPNWRAFLALDPRVVLLDLRGGQDIKAGESDAVRVLDDALQHLAGRPECLWVSAAR
ncbi:hypothetical protein B484DRAFT_397248 [Ochromonadaceae sp. CCMP2298]|nr:hypothetical protein B484DRAFT_397248 [Ochromonadaceae sp. CCMP2298]